MQSVGNYRAESTYVAEEQYKVSGLSGDSSSAVKC